VHDLLSTSVALVPRKLATITILTAGMLVSSNAETFGGGASDRSGRATARGPRDRAAGALLRHLWAD
jgi:hypothetical protein